MVQRFQTLAALRKSSQVVYSLKFCCRFQNGDLYAGVAQLAMPRYRRRTACITSPTHTGSFNYVPTEFGEQDG